MVTERMDYEALKPILYGRDEIKVREHFGTTLPKHYDATVVDSTASRMIARCKVWTTNWETVQKAIAPEVEEIRRMQIEDNISRLSLKEKRILLAYLQKEAVELT